MKWLILFFLMGCAAQKDNSPHKVYGILYIADWVKDRAYKVDSGYVFSSNARVWYAPRGGPFKEIEVAGFEPYKKKHNKDYRFWTSAMIHLRIVEITHH